MARSGPALIALALAAGAVVCLSSTMLSFVGSFAPTSSTPSLRSAQRAPAVEMAYNSGLQPHSEIDFDQSLKANRDQSTTPFYDQSLYVVLMTIICAFYGFLWGLAAPVRDRFRPEAQNALRPSTTPFYEQSLYVVLMTMISAFYGFLWDLTAPVRERLQPEAARGAKNKDRQGKYSWFYH